MSRYTFECPECNSTEEKEFSMNDYDAMVKCQKCSKCGKFMQRIFDIPAMIKLPAGTYNSKNNIQNGWNK